MVEIECARCGLPLKAWDIWERDAARNWVHKHCPTWRTK